MAEIGNAVFETADIASAATTNIGATPEWRLRVTGTIEITSLGSVANALRFLVFAAALTITPNGTTLNTQTGVPMVMAAGDTCLAGSDASGNWTLFGHAKASGKALSPSSVVEFFTGSGTSTKPNGATVCLAICVGPGGAGGSGRRGAAASVRCGGGGGAGGGIAWSIIPAALLGSTITVTIGSQAVPGAAISVDDTNGSGGTNATSTTFGAFLTGVFGTNGGGGTNAAGAAGSTSTSTFNGGGGAAASGTGGVGVAGTRAGMGGGGGASGGGITAADSPSNGAAGAPAAFVFTGATAGGTAGTTPGGNGGAGQSPGANFPIGAGGGGGGAGNIAGAGGTGGAGGAYGGGGGGGGASLNGNASGAGGAGGAGFAMVIWL